MKTRRLAVAPIVLALLVPTGSEAAASVVVHRESVDVIMQAMDGVNYADVFMQATIETRFDGSSVTVVRSTQGIMTTCDAQNCNFHSVNAERNEQQVSSEPLMNSFSISFDDGTASMDLTLSQPSQFVANCVSAGCVNPNIWYTPNTVHASGTVTQGYSRGQYMAAAGNIGGIPVSGGGAYANATVSVQASN
jgi:hypothetical protein